MKQILAVTLATMWLMADDPCRAAVISRDWKTPGDGLLTYDTVHQREWLDLTETRLAMFPGSNLVERYQSFLGELGPGRPYEGFTVAKANDLLAFGTSAGIDTSSTDFATNQEPVEALIDLVGISYGPSELGTLGSFGWLDPGTPPSAFIFGRLFSAPASGDSGGAQLFVGLFGGDLATAANTGVWVFRNIPEPSTFLTAMMSIIGLGLRKRASRRRTRQTGIRKRLAFEGLECRLPLTSADIVFLVDESESIGETGNRVHAWLQNNSGAANSGTNKGLVRRLEQVADTTFGKDLLSKGITDIRYGLIGYGGGSTDQAHSFVLNSSDPVVQQRQTGSNSQLITRLGSLSSGLAGNLEDGWDAIEHALAEYPFRPGAVPVLVLVQGEEGRVPAHSNSFDPNFFDPLRRSGVLAAMESKNVLFNTLVVGTLPFSDGAHDVFDLEPYGMPSDLRILGVEADVSGVAHSSWRDSTADGQHSFHWVDTNTATADAPTQTISASLQISHLGSNTGASGMVGSGKSILISTKLTGGIGGSASGDSAYRAKNVPFQFEDLATDSGAATISHAATISPANFQFPFFTSTHASFVVSGQGWIGLSDTGFFALDLDFSVDPGITVPFVAPYMDALATSGPNTQLLWKVAGAVDAPDRRLIVQWNQSEYGSTVADDPVTFQAVLYADGRIQFNYKELATHGGDPNGRFDEGQRANVGIWDRSADQSLTLPTGKFVPGPHSIFGARQNDLFNPTSEVNDSYIRLAWDTGGAAWDLGAVVETSATSSIANALRDAFVDSLGDQILRRSQEGKVLQSQEVVLALNVGSSTGVDLGAAGFFRPDNGAFTADAGVSAVDDYTISSGQAIALASNAIPSTAAGMQTVFRSMRGEQTQDSASGNDGVAENISFTIDALDNGNGGAAAFPNGRYVVELFFAEPAVDVSGAHFRRAFDVRIEGTKYLDAYDPVEDFARITTGTTQFNTNRTGPFAGVVKRFEVDVTSAHGAGLQIDLKRTAESEADPILSAVRILRADPARIEDVVIKGSTWAPGVEYSFATLVGNGQQLRPISTASADTIEIHFSGPVNLSASALTLERTITHATDINGLPTNTTIGGSEPSFVNDYDYDPVNFIAWWKFNSGVLANGKYAIHLDSSAVTSGGSSLDGGWVNLFGPSPTSATADDWSDDPKRPFIVGDGSPDAAGDKFRLNFALLAGDFNGDGVVTTADSPAGNGQFGDGNGDGAANSSDESVRTANIGKFLPLRRIQGVSGYHGADLKDNERIGSDDLAALLMRYTAGDDVNGDINGDGQVSGNDILLYQLLAGEAANKSAWYLGDSEEESEGVLIGDFPPWVTNVIVSGSLSLHAPFSFATVDGSGAQLATVPVGGADTITIVFSEAVNVAWDHLVLVGLRTGNLPTFASFSYDAVSHSASWRFEGWALADQYVLVLSDDVTDADGNRLDGEWTNPATLATTNSAVSEFPSGDGDPGGWFTFVMTLMPGDATRDNIVDYYDHYGVWIFNQDQFWGDATWIDGDFNGDGYVDGADMPQAMGTFLSNFQNLWLLADLDGDFDVDVADLMTIANNAGMTGATWEDGDLNGDGEVTEDDLDIALAQWGVMGQGLFLSVAA